MTGDDDTGSTQSGALVATDGTDSDAVLASSGFRKTSSGYQGQSEGWTDLASDHQMDWTYTAGQPGNGCGPALAGPRPAVLVSPASEGGRGLRDDACSRIAHQHEGGDDGDRDHAHDNRILCGGLTRFLRRVNSLLLHDASNRRPADGNEARKCDGTRTGAFRP